jgi:predicted nucleic acid-binding protein
MTADADREFVDANVLVYAFDTSAGDKCVRAKDLLDGLWLHGTGCLSVQVLQEFFVTVTRKVPKPLTIDDVTARIREFAAWRVFAPKTEDVLAAIALHKQTKLSFWDALIVEAASQLGCATLWTEDLTDGQTIRDVLVRNPFSAVKG